MREAMPLDFLENLLFLYRFRIDFVEKAVIPPFQEIDSGNRVLEKIFPSRFAVVMLLLVRSALTNAFCRSRKLFPRECLTYREKECINVTY